MNSWPHTKSAVIADVSGDDEQSDGEAKSAIAGPDDDRTISNRTIPDAIELALSDAIRKATDAGKFEVLPQLVAELQARRESRCGVVDLNVERKRRNAKA